MIIRLNKNTKAIIGAAACLILIIWAGGHYIPRAYGQYKFRTRFYSGENYLKPAAEEAVRAAIGDYCAEKRSETEKLYSADEMADLVKSGAGTMAFVGAEIDPDRYSSSSANGYISLDIAGKGIKLECFDFNRRVIVQGEGKIDIGYSEFKNISGHAIGLSNGSGLIHHNVIVGAAKAGIFADAGKYEIFSNIIKDNLSYGIYGGYGADLDIHENAILNNGGYEIRLMKEREVYE